MGNIYEATIQNLPHLIKLACLAHDKGNIDRLGEFNFEYVSQMFYDAIVSPDAVVLCSEAGVLAGNVDRMATGDLVAGELIWFAMDGNGPKLWKGFELWAKARGARYIIGVDNLSSPKPGKVSKFFNGKGYTPMYLTHIKEL